MKRFGTYDSKYNSLFKTYEKVNPSLYREAFIPIVQEKSLGVSYPDLKYVKIFLQKAGRGADLSHYGKVISIDSDDGKGNTIITAKDDNKILNIIVTSSSAQVKIIDDSGYVENEFITNVKPRYSSEQNELSIINIDDI